MGIIKHRFCEHCDEMVFTLPNSIRCQKCRQGTKESQPNCDDEHDSAQPDDDETDAEE